MICLMTMIEDLHLERVPSNNTQLVSCHLKLKLHFFPAYNMKGAHILKESKHVKGQLRPPPVNKKCLFVFLSQKMITSKVRWDPPSVTKNVCLSFCHEKWSLPRSVGTPRQWRKMSVCLSPKMITSEVSWGPSSVTKNVCLSVTKKDHFLKGLSVCLTLTFYHYFRTNYRK